jgi:hypothetical protein
MKKPSPPIILILILSLMGVVVIFFFRPAKLKTSGSEQILETKQAADTLTNTGGVSSNPSPAIVPQTIQNPAATQVPVDTNQISALRTLQLQREVSAQNAQVNFFGMVVDQNNQPVADASIKMFVRHSEYSASKGMTSTFPKLDVLTDSQGHFNWTEQSGDVLSLESIAKNGYALAPNTSHSFGPSSGSFENPVIFKMWKEGAKEPLIDGSHVFIIDSGKSYTLDLITGKKIEGEAEGDLRVSISRPSGVKQRDKYQWSFSIEAIQGGLLESDDEFMYLAPESGYEPKIDMQLNPDDSTWTQFVKKQFFLRSRNGQVYGRVQVEVDAIYNVNSAIQISYAINPNGSRNLQP